MCFAMCWHDISNAKNSKRTTVRTKEMKPRLFRICTNTCLCHGICGFLWNTKPPTGTRPWHSKTAHLKNLFAYCKLAPTTPELKLTPALKHWYHTSQQFLMHDHTQPPSMKTTNPRPIWRPWNHTHRTWVSPKPIIISTWPQKLITSQ